MSGEVVMRCIAVASGGALGALARYGLGLWGASLGTRLPWGTIAANGVGCLAMGAVMWLVAGRAAVPDGVRLFVAVGLLGGLTTFSAFSYEAVELYRDDHAALAAAYVVGSVLLGLVMALAGWWCAGAVLGDG